MTQQHTTAPAPLDLAQFEGFTPGPLETPGTDGDARVICYRDGGKRRTLAHVYGERQEADAALFVEAPALLAECQRQRAEIERLRGALERIPAIFADTRTVHEEQCVNEQRPYEAGANPLSFDTILDCKLEILNDQIRAALSGPEVA